MDLFRLQMLSDLMKCFLELGITFLQNIILVDNKGLYN